MVHDIVLEMTSGMNKLAELMMNLKIFYLKIFFINRYLAFENYLQKISASNIYPVFPEQDNKLIYISLLFPNNQQRYFHFYTHMRRIFTRVANSPPYEN